MQKMRTIKELAEMLKAEDAETKITATAIRRFITQGQLPCVTVGKKYLVSVDSFNEFLKGTKIEKTKITDFESLYTKK